MQAVVCPVFSLHMSRTAPTEGTQPVYSSRGGGGTARHATAMAASRSGCAFSESHDRAMTVAQSELTVKEFEKTRDTLRT